MEVVRKNFGFEPFFLTSDSAIFAKFKFMFSAGPFVTFRNDHYNSQSFLLHKIQTK